MPASGVEDRVAFHCRDAADPERSGRYDLVTISEALHDMSYPVDVLRTARALLSDGGRVLVADEKTAERFALDAADVVRVYYGLSVLHCLPVGMVGENAAGTATVMRENTVRAYTEQAGFADCEVAPIENDFWRLYLLTQSATRGGADTGWRPRCRSGAQPSLAAAMRNAPRRITACASSNICQLFADSPRAPNVDEQFICDRHARPNRAHRLLQRAAPVRLKAAARGRRVDCREGLTSSKPGTNAPTAAAAAVEHASR